MAQVFLPEQEVSDNVITIQINEGKLDKNQPYILKKNNVRLYDGLVPKYLDDALEVGLTSKALERGLLNLNSLPGIKASSTITSGDEVGTSKIALNLIEENLISGSVLFDNFGNRYTGKLRTNISVNFNNPLNMEINYLFKKYLIHLQTMIFQESHMNFQFFILG